MTSFEEWFQWEYPAHTTGGFKLEQERAYAAGALQMRERCAAEVRKLGVEPWGEVKIVNVGEVLTVIRKLEV